MKNGSCKKMVGLKTGKEDRFGQAQLLINREYQIVEIPGK